MRETVTFSFVKDRKEPAIDLEVSFDITANDLILALNKAFSLGLNTSKIQSCYLKAENPLALIKGNRTLREIGIINGSVIRFDASVTSI